MTLIGVRATTARGMAATAVDLVCKKLGKRAPRSATAYTPIYGGQIEEVATFHRQAMQQCPSDVDPQAMQALLRNHGTAYGRVLHYLRENPTWGETLPGSTVLKAEVIHAVRTEMAQKLSDVVFRRTELGTGSHPGEAALRVCVTLMAAELGWDAQRQQKELEEVHHALQSRAGSPHSVLTRP